MGLNLLIAFTVRGKPCFIIRFVCGFLPVFSTSPTKVEQHALAHIIRPYIKSLLGTAGSDIECWATLVKIGLNVVVVQIAYFQIWKKWWRFLFLKIAILKILVILGDLISKLNHCNTQSLILHDKIFSQGQVLDLVHKLYKSW